MLTDAQVERYARQVIVPEVGARGQARLLAARVAVLGATPLAAHVADLLCRSGTAVTSDPHGADAIVLAGTDAVSAIVASNPNVPVVIADPSNHRPTVTVLATGCCPRCVPAPPSGPAEHPADPVGICAAHVVAAMAATETLLVLLDGSRASRRFRLDLDTGTPEIGTLATAPCGHGGRSA